MKHVLPRFVSLEKNEVHVTQVLSNEKERTLSFLRHADGPDQPIESDSMRQNENSAVCFLATVETSRGVFWGAWTAGSASRMSRKNAH